MPSTMVYIDFTKEKRDRIGTKTGQQIFIFIKKEHLWQ